MSNVFIWRVEELERIGKNTSGLLTTEDGFVWHPANYMLWAADTIRKQAANVKRLEKELKDLKKEKGA
jgi:hypothetical protein